MICAVSKTNQPHPRNLPGEKQNRSKNTTWVANQNNTDDSTVSTFIPTRNRLEPCADFWPWEFNCISWVTMLRGRSDVSRLFLFSNTQLYIVLIHNYQDRSGECYSLARSGPSIFETERQESTIEGKQVWYFALLANQETIEQITRPRKITSPSQTSSGSQPFLYMYISLNGQPPSFLYNCPNLPELKDKNPQSKENRCGTLHY